jgi:hypothetical protein
VLACSRRPRAPSGSRPRASRPCSWAPRWPIASPWPRAPPAWHAGRRRPPARCTAASRPPPSWVRASKCGGSPHVPAGPREARERRPRTPVRRAVGPRAASRGAVALLADSLGNPLPEQRHPQLRALLPLPKIPPYLFQPVVQCSVQESLEKKRESPPYSPSPYQSTGGLESRLESTGGAESRLARSAYGTQKAPRGASAAPLVR